MPARPAALPVPANPRARWPVTQLRRVAYASCAAALVAAFWLYQTWPPAWTGDAPGHAEAHRTELANRLRLADRVLRTTAAELAARGHAALALGATEKRYFNALTLARPGEDPATLLGATLASPEISAPMRARLASGDSLVLVGAARAALPAPVLMLRGLPRAGELLLAEVAPGYLWFEPRDRPEATDFCVRDASGATLHCSSARVERAGRFGQGASASRRQPGLARGRRKLDRFPCAP